MLHIVAPKGSLLYEANELGQRLLDRDIPYTILCEEQDYLHIKRLEHKFGNFIVGETPRIFLEDGKTVKYISEQRLNYMLKNPIQMYGINGDPASSRAYDLVRDLGWPVDRIPVAFRSGPRLIPMSQSQHKVFALKAKKNHKAWPLFTRYDGTYLGRTLTRILHNVRDSVYPLEAADAAYLEDGSKVRLCLIDHYGYKMINLGSLKYLRFDLRGKSLDGGPNIDWSIS